MGLVGERLEHWTYCWPVYNMLSGNEMDLGAQIIEWLPGVDPEADRDVAVSEASQEILRSNE